MALFLKMRVSFFLVLLIPISIAIFLPENEIINEKSGNYRLDLSGNNPLYYSVPYSAKSESELRQEFIENLRQVAIKMNVFVSERQFDSVRFARPITQIREDFVSFHQTLSKMRKRRYFPNLLRRLFED